MNNNTTKSIATNIVKINYNTPTYRKLGILRRKTVHHTYQLKEYRFMIKYITKWMQKTLQKNLKRYGHNARNNINMKHRKTRQPLNLFFVDFEPSTNNKDIYILVKLQNIKTKIQPHTQK